MKLFWLVALTMVAFAGNSILNRMALASGSIGPSSFVLIRLISGAAILGALVFMRNAPRPNLSAASFASAVTLVLYVVGFSFAYLTLPAGVGALVLFGGVQITMLAGTLLTGERISMWGWGGAVLAFSALCYLLWPTSLDAPDAIGSALMIAAAFGWGLFSMLGRGVADPLGSTALAFMLASPLGLCVWAAIPDGATPAGVWLAIASGAMTSGLGYALWYKVLPQISGPVAAVAQLTVPVIAAAAGAVFLGEALTARFALSTVGVLSGVGLTVYGQMRKPAR